jgi:hypothetical protein
MTCIVIILRNFIYSRHKNEKFTLRVEFEFPYHSGIEKNKSNKNTLKICYTIRKIQLNKKQGKKGKKWKIIFFILYLNPQVGNTLSCRFQ